MKIETKYQRGEFEKFDSDMKALIAVPKPEIAEKPKKANDARRDKKTKSQLLLSQPAE